jgi:RNA polymerase sigma-70 factor (ECF subfamily)
VDTITAYVRIGHETATTEPADGLVGLSRDGDRDAFALLVRPHLVPALGAARIITGSESDGADAVQDALLLAWQRLPQLREPALFPAWFRQIVVRAATKVARRRRPIAELDLTESGSVDELDQALDLRTLRRAIARLEVDDRVLLTLREFWDLSVAETARMLAIPEGTVKSKLHHAIRRLRAAYDAEERA